MVIILGPVAALSRVRIGELSRWLVPGDWRYPPIPGTESMTEVRPSEWADTLRSSLPGMGTSRTVRFRSDRNLDEEMNWFSGTTVSPGWLPLLMRSRNRSLDGPSCPKGIGDQQR